MTERTRHESTSKRGRKEISAGSEVCSASAVAVAAACGSGCQNFEEEEQGMLLPFGRTNGDNLLRFILHFPYDDLLRILISRTEEEDNGCTMCMRPPMWRRRRSRRRPAATSSSSSTSSEAKVFWTMPPERGGH